MPGGGVDNSIVSRHRKGKQASDEREELVLTRQSSIRTVPGADVLSLRQQKKKQVPMEKTLNIISILESYLKDLDCPSVLVISLS